MLGLAILGFSVSYSGISTQVGAAVAVALPVSPGGRVRVEATHAAASGLAACPECNAAHSVTRASSLPELHVPVACPQLVSLWANGLGAFLTLMADRMK